MDFTQDLWSKLQQTTKSILIYGMGDGCDKILRVCQEKGIRISGIFASDEYVRNKCVHGFEVTGFSEAKKKFPQRIILLAFGVFREDLMEKILKMAEEEELYAPEVPLFGGSLFDLDYYREHKSELERVREMLADDASRLVFDCLLEYKLTGRIDPLIRCESRKEEDMKSLIPYRPGDVYLDLGAYDGDTILEWVTLHPDHGKVIGVEPGKKTIEKLKRNCAHIRDLETVWAAVWNDDAPVPFNGKSGRSAAIDPGGKEEVPGVRVSSLTDRADFIKFDVEGAEKEALEGAEEIIKKQKSTLCVSAYHRTEDLFALPLLVKEVMPNYRVYLRHWPYIPAWDTVYIFTAR